MGILWQVPPAGVTLYMFQSQVAILGWGYLAIWPTAGELGRFQSQVAILGWGYPSTARWCAIISAVSIAGGDSWVGIPPVINGETLGTLIVSIAGGDSWVGIRVGKRSHVAG